MNNSATNILMCAFLFLASSQSVLGCSCSFSDSLLSEDEQVAEQFNSSSAVFVGEVTKGISESTLKKRFSFDVSRVFKGPNDRNLDILTGAGGGDCGYPFKVGEKYLVFAYGEKNDSSFRTNICTRTKLLETAESDLKILRRISKSKKSFHYSVISDLKYLSQSPFFASLIAGEGVCGPVEERRS